MVQLAIEEGDTSGALELLDKRDRLEKCVLLELKKHPNGYQNALQNIARFTRTIYSHSYQSYVWN
jgi:tRNA(Glu) U13 pseudouridine synthase TruD